MTTTLTHATVTDKQIHDLLHEASSRGHLFMVEVCAAALERNILPSRSQTDIQRQRVAEALNTGTYQNVPTWKLPQAELRRLHAVIGGHR